MTTQLKGGDAQQKLHMGFHTKSATAKLTLEKGVLAIQEQSLQTLLCNSPWFEGVHVLVPEILLKIAHSSVSGVVC